MVVPVTGEAKIVIEQASVYYSFGVINGDEPVKIPAVPNISEVLLNERHLSKSALRALDVLDFFADRQSPARATDVAHALGLGPSTADQLLKTLVSRAYLIFDVRQKRYHPSPRLLRFSGFIDKAYYGGHRLQTLMQTLVDATHLSVSVSTPFGRLMQLVDVLNPPDTAYDGAPGHLFSLFNSAAGNALLADWPIRTVRALIAQSEDQLGPLVAYPDKFCRHLNEIRSHGHAFGGLSMEVEKCSLAVALPEAGFGTELSLSLRGPIKWMKENRWRLAAMLEETVSAVLTPAAEHSTPVEQKPFQVLKA